MKITRRSLLLGAAAAAGAQSTAQSRYAMAREITEWIFISAKPYKDTFNEIELDVIVRDPHGNQQTVPAFWAGDQEWRARFAADAAGRYSFETVCSDKSNPDLHGRRGLLEVAPYEGKNPLLSRGPLRVASDRRHFEHADGTPLWPACASSSWWIGASCRSGASARQANIKAECRRSGEHSPRGRPRRNR